MFSPAFLAWQNSSANLIEPVGPPLLVFLLGVETMPSARHGRRTSIKRENDDNRSCTAPIHAVNMKDILDVNKINMSLFAQHTMNFLQHPRKDHQEIQAIHGAEEKIRSNAHLVPPRTCLRNTGPNPARSFNRPVKPLDLADNHCRRTGDPYSAPVVTICKFTRTPSLLYSPTRAGPLDVFFRFS
jgi:hypothetical protein